MIFFIVLLLLIIVLSLLSKDLFRNIIEPLQTSIGTNKGTLYILLEAPGFNVPELQVTKELMSPSVAQSKFSKVVVIANSAKYKNPSTDSNIMTDQWDNVLVQNLGLPVERWCFVCCSSNAPGGINANTLINNLTTNFTNIKGFLIDSEDDPTSIVDFVNEFNNLGTSYQYAIVGGIRKSIPPLSKYGINFNKFFSEVYTEGTNQMDKQYYIQNNSTVQGAGCVLMDSSGVSTFWNGVNNTLGTNEDVVPTVCGSGNCQELLYGNPCFDERLSNKNIDNLLSGNTSGRKNFAIWYGTGQQLSCSPSNTCMQLLDTNSCSTNSKCAWSPYKSNPITKTKGLCYALPSNWGCSTNW